MIDDLIVFPSAPVSDPVPESVIDPKLKRAQSLVGTSKGRPTDDFYPTPANAVTSLLSVERFEGLVWEPACGDGAICKVLTATGHEVLATDLVDRGYGVGGHDFFSSPHRATNIITNPPYSLGERFVRHALTCTTGKVAMLMKLAFLEGGKRKTLFETTPLRSVHVFSKRLTMHRNGEKGRYGSGMIAFAWFVWDHDFRGTPTLGWL